MGLIRARKRDDIELVAQDTRLAVDEVNTIKKHVLFGKHRRFVTKLEKVIRKRFDAYR
jgi:hypothetical protein